MLRSRPMYPHRSRKKPAQSSGTAGPTDLTAALPFPLEHGDRLTQGKNLDCQVTPAAEEDLDGGQESQDEFEHEHYVLTRVTPPTEIGGPGIGSC